MYFIAGNGERVPVGPTQAINLDVASPMDYRFLFEPMELSFTAKATTSTRWAVFANYAWPRFFKRGSKLLGKWVR
jgi:hypothetical protein